MASGFVTQNPRASTSASLIQTLSSLLLRSGAGPVALLRPITKNFDPDRDDIDLLLTEPHRAALLNAALEEAVAGKIHFSVRQKCSEKTQLTLWDLATNRRLTVDLWSAFCQLPRFPRKLIRAEELLRFAGHGGDPCAPGAGTTRLSADVEFCLLVLHLAFKKKSLSSATARERIREASDRLTATIPELLTSDRPVSELASLTEVSEGMRTAARSIPTRFILIAEDYLLARLSGSTLRPRTNRNLMSGFRGWLMRRVPCVAVVGSDGAGKSSVCDVISRRQISGTPPIVAKKLYRRSWLYRIVSSATKRVTGIDRGRFDDSVAQLITLRAAVSLWVRLSSCLAGRPSQAILPVINAAPRTGHPTALLLDRSVNSFLITKRKSGHPRLSRLAAWLELILPPVTTVLLVVPFRALVRRKAEFTSAAGHTRYQQILFEQALRQQPCDLIVVANTGSAHDAASALDAIRSFCRGIQSRRSASSNSADMPHQTMRS